MYREIHKRHKWKKKALAGLYLIFILASISEIFLNLNHLDEAKIKRIEFRETLEIPLHLPHEAHYDFIRLEKEQRYKEN